LLTGFGTPLKHVVGDDKTASVREILSVIIIKAKDRAGTVARQDGEVLPL